MQSRVAVILSLGMLMEKVDAGPFIAKLLAKAKEENTEFKFTAELQKMAFGLSEQFNQGKLEPEDFATKEMALLGIKTMTLEAFWQEWNRMVKMGDVADNIKKLQDAAHEHKALFYLTSDTNRVHLKAITEGCTELGIKVDATVEPVMFAEMPLYASCRVGKGRQALIKQVVESVQSKQQNKPSVIRLIYGDPANITDPALQMMVKKEHEQLAAWCKENNIELTLHGNSLDNTLNAMFSPKHEEIPKMAIGGM